MPDIERAVISDRLSNVSVVSSLRIVPIVYRDGLPDLSGLNISDLYCEYASCGNNSKANRIRFIESLLMMLSHYTLLRNNHLLRINLLSVDNQRVEEHALADFITSKGDAVHTR